MRNIRTCVNNTLSTGKSGCQIDFGKIRSIILVPHGQAITFPTTASALKAACHALLPNRIYPIKDIVEYAKNGGEPQVSSVGYGGSGVTGISARTDTFTLATYSEHLAASLTKNMNRRFDAYYVDENNMIYGVNKNDALYGIPMETVYCTVTPHPTSSAKATMTVSCCLENVRDAIESFDYVQANFNVHDALIGLVPVDLVEVEAGKYKIIETMGGYDRTEELGSSIASVDNFSNCTAVTYSNGLLTITTQENAVPELKNPSFINAVAPGIEFNKTVKLP